MALVQKRSLLAANFQLHGGRRLSCGEVLMRFCNIVLIATSLLYGVTGAVLAQAPDYLSYAKEITNAQAGGEKPLQADVSDLKPGQSIERRLAENQSHFYGFTLSEGQYLHITVDQKDADVEIQLSNPAGQVIGCINWEHQDSTESMWASAEAPGNYQVKIITGPASGGGSYVVTLDKVGVLQNAPKQDQDYVKAYRLFWEACKLRDQGGSALHQAAVKFEEDLLLWRALEDKIGEAFTLHELGFALNQLGEIEHGLEAYSQSLQIWRSSTDHALDEANSLYNMGSIYAGSGRTTEAIDCYNKIMELRHDPGGRAYAFTNLGQVYINLGEFQSALKSHEEALRLRRTTRDIEGQARSLSNISGVYFSLGEFQEALNYCLLALPLRRAAGDHRGEAITLSNIGSNYRELGEWQKAFEYSQQALSNLLAIGDGTTHAAVLQAVGRDYYDLGEYPKRLRITSNRFRKGER